MEDVQYATADGHHLAYSERSGAPGRDIVVFTPGSTIPMAYLERDRIGVRLLDGLAAMGRLVLFDRRGIGLSDPVIDWSRPLVQQWADDLAVVVATACTEAPVVIAFSDNWGPARLFAARHPDAVSSLVLYEPQGPLVTAHLISRSIASVKPGAETLPGDDWIARVCPTRAGDRLFREWFDEAGRMGAGPTVAARVFERPPDDCVRALETAHGRIAAPTLVLRRPGNLLGAAPTPDPIASSIPNARRVDLSGPDYHWLGEDVDELLAEISRFVTGDARLPEPSRVLCAVLFTDLVGSTEQAATVGDTRWKAILDRHDATVAEEIRRAGGSVVNTTGDGIVATLPSGERALRAAESIRARLTREGLGVRIGVHVADVERRGDDIAGIAVHVAARVTALAGPGEILVTAPVPTAVLGTDHRFEPAGDHALKGVPGTWQVYRHAGRAR